MVLTGLDLTLAVVGSGRVLEVVDLDPVRDQVSVPAQGLGLGLAQDLGLGLGLDLDRAMAPITGRVLDRRAARLALLRLVIMRLNRLSPRLRPLAIFLPSKSKNISRRGPQNCRSLSDLSPLCHPKREG
jgi:hypothetical protein